MDALGSLYDYFTDKLTRFFLMRVHDRWLADDLTSETWTRVAGAIPRFRVQKGAGFTAWLFTIARSVHTDNTRRCARRPEQLRGDWLDLDTPQSGDGPDGSAARTALSRLLAEAVNNLPIQQARVLTCLLFLELSVAEAAEVLGKSPGTIRKAQHDALKNLRGRLGGLDLTTFCA
jgi:RNA polymerase sigma-70 factor (ECF subfamily)